LISVLIVNYHYTPTIYYYNQ